MNARSQVFEMALEPRQVEEAVLSLFHTVMFHRSFGKFSYQNDDTYFVGTLGFEDVDCHFIDHTYVRTHSPELTAAIQSEVSAFSTDLCSMDPVPSGSGAVGGSVGAHYQRPGAGVKSGQVSLEFYQRRRKWPFLLESIPWEVWTLRTELVNFSIESQRQRWQEKVGEMLCDKVLYVAEVMNRHDYVPKTPSVSELELVFDTAYTDVQPYLFKISYETKGVSSPSVGTTVRRLLKDTLAI